MITTKIISISGKVLRTAIRGTIPPGYELKTLLSIEQHPELIIKEMSTTSNASVFHIKGGYVLKRYSGTSRSSLQHNAVKLFDIQHKLAGHPQIEEVVFAYSTPQTDILITRFKPISPAILISKEYLDALLDILCYMDMQGIIHNDLSLYNGMIDGNGAPFIIDFDKARMIDWQSTGIPPELISAYFENPTSTIRTEVFNIDTFQTYLLADKMIELDIDQNNQSDALKLFKHFLKASITYFEKINLFFKANGVNQLYINAVQERLSKLRLTLQNPDKLLALYKNKMTDNLYVAYRWSNAEVTAGRTELKPYKNQAKARLLKWINERNEL